MTSVTIYHNPRCSKSRQSLALLEQHGIDINVIEYLKHPPDAATLARICRQLDCEPIDIIRQGEEAFKRCGLGPDSNNDDVIAAIIDAPILMQRPIIICETRARIGRPPEAILEILPKGSP